MLGQVAGEADKWSREMVNIAFANRCTVLVDGWRAEGAGNESASPRGVHAMAARR
jgi:hypothetical protein